MGREITLNERLEHIVINILLVLTGLGQALMIALIAFEVLSGFMKPRRRRG